MRHSLNGRSAVGLCSAVLAFTFAAGIRPGFALGQWNQWGGPRQDFTADSTGLASAWSEAGPKKVWSRELGEGYSGISVEGGKLYTLYRAGEEEVICALDAASGKTLWETKYVAPPAEGHEMAFTAAPRSTPLIDGGRVYTAGVAGIFHCLDATTGSVIWRHDLWKDHGGSFLNHGYCTSPFPYKDTIIMLVGGEDHAVMAFKKSDGSVVWKSQSFKNSYSTPKLINVDGEDQLACFMANEVIGVDPNTGALKWSFAHGNQWGQNICMPILSEDNILFISSPEAGTRGLKLKRNGDKTEVEEAWSTRKMQLYHVNAVKIGDYVYGSSGTGMGGPTFFSCINIKDGSVKWRERGFAKSTFVLADGKFIILDEEGNLGLATATPEKFTVLAKVPLLDKVAWTVPTVVNRTLYVRDKKNIMALDLG